jgi:hypothetical protein
MLVSVEVIRDHSRRVLVVATQSLGHQLKTGCTRALAWFAEFTAGK